MHAALIDALSFFDKRGTWPSVHETMRTSSYRCDTDWRRHQNGPKQDIVETQYTDCTL
jgi:hypothetical protein